MKIGRARPWMTVVLILINLLVFGVQCLLAKLAPNAFEYTFGLSWQKVAEGDWWQFITYAFLHANSVHLGLNMIGLWFSGRMVEPVIGPLRLVLLYFFAAVGGGVLQLLCGHEGMLLLGASASVCGLIVAFTSIYPDAELFILLFFIIPLKVRAKFLGWAVVLTSLLFLVLRFETWIGHAAHLGGALAGFVFARLSGFAPPGAVERWLYGRWMPKG